MGKTTPTAAITKVLHDKYPEPQRGVCVDQIDKAPEEKACGITDLDRARRVPDREAALRARRSPRARRLHQEHDHRCGADGRRDPGGRGDRRPDAADQGAQPPGPPGRRPLHRRRAEQGRHGRRRGDPRARRARGPRAALRVRVPGRRRPVARVSALKALEGDAEWATSFDGAAGRGRHRDPEPEREIDKPFLMPVEDVFTITGRGTVVTGRVERGIVKVSEEIEIVGIREN